MAQFDFQALRSDARRRMEGAIEVLHKEFGGLRTGRANTSLLEPVSVEAYGSHMRLNQMANIAAPDARTLTVQVWDKTLVKAVERAIRESALGLNPSVDGALIRVPIPALSEERRRELTKAAAKYAEECRVAVRNVRRHVLDALKKGEKDGKISEDEHRQDTDAVQKLTDEYIKKIDEILVKKDKDIMRG